LSLLALATIALLSVGPRLDAANITIDATFDSSITALPNAGTIESGINAAIGRLESVIENPITVSIDFTNMSSGLGESSTDVAELSYTKYLSDLAHNQILSADDNTALAHLPAGPNNPVNGTPDVFLTKPLLRAIGEATLGNVHGGFDGTISLNTSIMNVSRTGPQNPGDYDLQAVVTHEMDEVLGIGGAGSALPTSSSPFPPPVPVGALDLFRYDANGNRSFTTSSGVASYFSIDGGATLIMPFNQAGGGSDYGDWATTTTPQVQDAFGSPGMDLNLGPNELESFDVVGYNLVTEGSSLASAPEPSSLAGLIGLGAMGLFFAALRRRGR
jgi:hypothetical protein